MTRCRCDGKYNTDLVANLLLSPTVKELKYRSTFVKVMNEYRVTRFLWLTEYYYTQT